MNKGLTIQTALVLLLTLIALVLLSLTVAYRLWLWFAPPVEAPAPPALPLEFAVQSTVGLFGIPPDSAPVISLLPASTGLAFRLLGIVAAQGDGADYAVIQVAPGTIVAIREGEDIAPGVRLTTVHNDHLILERSGVQETLSWPQP
ncbi:MAG: type II secretion system protein N [Pseudohongiella sp.]|nr:type II secretion system protein N [Pseudohongiella sp.]MDP2286794.1 type II secretion system protein N [Pseudohongiella sp.]